MLLNFGDAQFKTAQSSVLTRAINKISFASDLAKNANRTQNLSNFWNIEKLICSGLGTVSLVKGMEINGEN